MGFCYWQASRKLFFNMRRTERCKKLVKASSLLMLEKTCIGVSTAAKCAVEKADLHLSLGVSQA